MRIAMRKVAAESSSDAGLRGTLLARQNIVATFLMLPRTEIVETLAKAGFDAVIIDLEHGPMVASDLPPLVSAARASGIRAIARVARNSAVEIGHALDAGVDGVLVPHVTSAADAESVVNAGRFAPAGDRSVNPYARGNGYDLGVDETTESINRSVGIIAMLEGADAIANLETIGSVPGLDAIFIGPVDLSSSLGLGGDTEHPLVIEAVTEALARANDAGCYTGIYAPTPEAGARWLAAGARLVALSADVAMAMRAFAATYSALQDSVARVASPAIADEGADGAAVSA